MSQNGFLESFLWPACMWLTHAFVGLLLCMVLVLIVPEFAAVLADFEAELPAMTQLIIELSHMLAAYWYLVLPLFLVLHDI